MAIFSDSLFARPVKIQDTVAERRLWLLKDRAELGEALGRLGIQDPLLGIKGELEQALLQLVAERPLSMELQVLVDRIKPLGDIYFPKKDIAHIAEMLSSIEKASKHLPAKGTQKIAGLLARLKGFYQQEERRDAATAVQFSCSLHGLTTGYLYLPVSVMNKLLPLNAKGEVVKSMLGMVGGGTRAVNRHDNIFCKDKPEAPSYQFAWDTLLQIFCDDNTAASQFARAHRKSGNEDITYQTQASLAVNGDMSFSKLVTEHPHLLDKLDPILFCKTVVAHITWMTQDASENNFMAMFTKDRDGNIVNIRWKGFDDDRWGVHSPARAGKEYHFNNMRSIFLCMKKMYQRIHPFARKHFAEMNPARGTLQFLKEMADYNRLIKELQKQENISAETLQEMFMPFLLVSDFISNQYQKLCKIRNFMRHAPLGKTHMDMWQEVDPVLAHFYDIINKKFPNSSYDAFLKVYFRGGPTIEENMAPLLSRHLVHNVPLSEYLKTCNHDADDFEALRDTPPELAAEKWLANDLNFAIYPPEEQSEILEVLQTFALSEITLRNCTQLKDFNIRTLLQSQKGLQKLTLIGCDKLTNAALSTIFEVHPNIELTLVGCPKISQEAIASFKSKNIKVRNLGELVVVELPAAPEGFEEQMRDLTQALDEGNWKQVRERHTALKASGIGDKAEILVIEHLIKTDQMRKIVKTNAIDALEFLAHINFKFSDRDINEACLFHLCCQEGNVEMLRWLCGQPVKWEVVVDQKGATPWHIAVASENLPCLFVLKEAKAPINLQDLSCVGPLRLSLERKSVKIASWLIEAGANIEEKNWHKQSLLHLACQNGLTEVVNLLLQRSPKMADCQDDMGKSPLNSTIEFGQIDCFHKVLNAVQSVQVADAQGITPLMQAAQLNHPEMVRALLAKGANPKDINKEEMNAAQIAALAGSLPCLKLLFGDNPPLQTLSIKRKDGKTLLHLAALSGNLETIRWLAKPELLATLDEAGLTAAHYAAQAGNWEVFSALVQAGFPINFQETPERETCLMLALRGHHYEVADQMIATGANLNAKDSRERHPIHRAAQDGDAPLIRTLVEKYRADVNMPAKAKKTPLHFAAACGHIPAIEVLFALNANRNTTTLDKEAPLFFAVQNGKEAAVRLLIGNGADISVTKSSGDTLLHYAAWYGQPKLAAYLLSLQPDLVHRKTIDQGHTPLHRAMYQRIDTFDGPPAEKENLRQRQLEVVKTLLRYGADVDARDNGDFTPLHLTGRWGRPDFARLLLSRGASIYARYDKSKFTPGSKRDPAECRTPEEHCYHMMNTDDKALKKAIEETAQVLKEHARSLQESQKHALLKKVPSLLLGEQGLSDLLAKPLEDRKSALIHKFADDAGFRPDSLLLLRSIEEQYESHPVQDSALFIHKLQEIYREWNCAIPKEMSSHHLTLRYETPLTPQQIRERWLSSDKSQHLEEIVSMIPLLGRPGDILQQLSDLAESNPSLTEKELKTLFAILTLLRGHEAWTSADFVKSNCLRMTQTLSKFKKSALKDNAAPAKEFLDDPSLCFPKLRLDGDWREKGVKERAQKLLGELSDALKYPKKREDLVNHLTSSIMGLHKELFQRIRISDFRAGANPVSKEAATALTELQRSSRDLTANCLIFLLQDGGYDLIGKRLEFVIDWMRKSALYGDFHQATALYEAIEHPSVSRLKKAFDRISSTSREQLLQLEKLFLPEADFQHYFACLRQRLSPSIPSLWIMLRLHSQKESPEARYALLRHIQEHRAFAAKLTLPPINAASECLMPLTTELFPQEYRRKREDSRPGELFAWERSNLLKSNKNFIASGKINV